MSDLSVLQFLCIEMHRIMSTHASCVVLLKFMLLHRCISFRYARYTMRGREARDDGTEPQDGVGGRILKREGPVGATEDPAQGRKVPRPC